MSTTHDSFDASPMGAFKASRFSDARNRRPSVLYTQSHGNQVSAESWADQFLRPTLQSAGIVIDAFAPFNGDIGGYSLVIHRFVFGDGRDPIGTRPGAETWFEQVEGYGGRILFGLQNYVGAGNPVAGAAPLNALSLGFTIATTAGGNSSPRKYAPLEHHLNANVVDGFLGADYGPHIEGGMELTVTRAVVRENVTGGKSILIHRELDFFAHQIIGTYLGYAPHLGTRLIDDAKEFLKNCARH